MNNRLPLEYRLRWSVCRVDLALFGEGRRRAFDSPRHPDRSGIDGCDLNDHFWVFAATATNVETTLRVRDVLTGEVKAYRNPLGNPAAAITDTEAFAACP